MLGYAGYISSYRLWYFVKTVEVLVHVSGRVNSRNAHFCSCSCVGIRTCNEERTQCESGVA